MSKPLTILAAVDTTKREVFAMQLEGNGKLHYDDFGSRLQIKGVVFGNGMEDYLLALPGSVTEIDVVDALNPTWEQWRKILAHSDKGTLVITDPERTLIKAIIQKSTRQVQEIFRWAIYRRDKYTCQYCGATDQPLTIDEYLCQGLGGLVTEENCKTACRSCNKAKSNMTIAEWEEYRKRKGLHYGDQ